MTMPRPIVVRPIVLGLKSPKKTRTAFGTYVDVATGEAPKVGDIFYHARTLLDRRGSLSPEYWKAYAVRPRYPIVLVLPDGVWWDIDARAYAPGLGFRGNGWTVTSVPPLERITVRPSIRTTLYHGILTRGVLVPCRDSAT